MIKHCLFPVAGYGTRFLPATKAIPKEMLPILTTPLIEYGVQEAHQMGCENICMVTSRYKKAIEDHFDRHTDIELSIQGSSKEQLLEPTNTLIDALNFSFIRQKQMRGLGDAILQGEPLIGNNPFGVILPDDLCYSSEDGVLLQMAKLFDIYRCPIVAIEEVPLEQTDKYGVIKGELIDGRDDLYEIETMVEKPAPSEAPSNLAVIGRYILVPEIFDFIKSTKPGKGGEIQITDALMSYAKEHRVLAYKFKGKRFDCGSLDGFVEATNFHYELLRK